MKNWDGFVPWLGLWLLLILVVVLGLGSLNWVRFYRLADHGVPTEGIITSSPDMKNHGIAKYSYTVGAQRFDSQGYPVGNVGQEITVYFLPEAPRISWPGNPRKPLQNETLSIGLAALFVPPLIVFSIRSQWLRRFRRQ